MVNTKLINLFCIVVVQCSFCFVCILSVLSVSIKWLFDYNNVLYVAFAYKITNMCTRRGW